LKRGNEAALPNTKELLTYCFDSIRMMVMRYRYIHYWEILVLEFWRWYSQKQIGRIGDEQ
jgi:aryl carrier-like protein